MLATSSGVIYEKRAAYAIFFTYLLKNLTYVEGSSLGIDASYSRFCPKCLKTLDKSNFKPLNYPKCIFCKRKYYREYMKKRRTSDSLFRLKDCLRCRLRDFITHSKMIKLGSFKEYIGCDKVQLKKHFESKFHSGMTWDNYGEWHVDHIIPLSSAKTEEELYKLCHYTNLQPLWAKDNLKKGFKIL